MEEQMRSVSVEYDGVRQAIFEIWELDLLSLENKPEQDSFRASANSSTATVEHRVKEKLTPFPNLFLISYFFVICSSISVLILMFKNLTFLRQITYVV